MAAEAPPSVNSDLIQASAEGRYDPGIEFGPLPKDLFPPVEIPAHDLMRHTEQWQGRLTRPLGERFMAHVSQPGEHLLHRRLGPNERSFLRILTEQGQEAVQAEHGYRQYTADGPGYKNATSHAHNAGGIVETIATRFGKSRPKEASDAIGAILNSPGMTGTAEEIEQWGGLFRPDNVVALREALIQTAWASGTEPRITANTIRSSGIMSNRLNQDMVAAALGVNPTDWNRQRNGLESAVPSWVVNRLNLVIGLSHQLNPKTREYEGALRLTSLPGEAPAQQNERLNLRQRLGRMAVDAVAPFRGRPLSEEDRIQRRMDGAQTDEERVASATRRNQRAADQAEARARARHEADRAAEERRAQDEADRAAQAANPDTNPDNDTEENQTRGRRLRAFAARVAGRALRALGFDRPPGARIDERMDRLWENHPEMWQRRPAPRDGRHEPPAS